MTICEFCGKEIPDGGICSCDEALAAAENMPGVSDEIYGDDAEISISDEITEDTVIDGPEQNSTDDVNVLDFLDNPQRPVYQEEEGEHEQVTAHVEYESNAQPEQHYTERPAVQQTVRRRVSKKAIMRRRRCAALAAILLFICGISFIHNHTGCRGAVHSYWKCVVDEDGGADYYTLGLPRVLIKHFKDTGEWKNLIGNYENLSAKAVKLKKIKKKKRMTKDELRAAEDYLYNLARIYGAKTADGEIIADKGYFVTVVYKFGEDKVLGGAYYVKIEGDGWKVLPHDMEG